LIERGRRVSFDEAWRNLGVDGARTYVIMHECYFDVG
jgi:hypothetical protein